MIFFGLRSGGQCLGVFPDGNGAGTGRKEEDEYVGGLGMSFHLWRTFMDVNTTISVETGRYVDPMVKKYKVQR